MGPIRQADIAKLMKTSTGHVIAPFIFLNENFAFWTSSIILMLRLELRLAVTFVLDHMTLLTVIFITNRTLQFSIL